ncbi:MAG TPA: hypothetical protein VKI17_10335, partial [Gemmataceae bacterium]|nr:hypothetical protein [Gemmataceae bacterium]
MTPEVSQWPTYDKAWARHREVEQLLADAAVIADRARYAQLAKEHGALSKQVKPYQEYLKITEE